MSGTILSMEQLKKLFDEASIEDWKASDGFTSLVEYIFTRAGYEVRPFTQPGASMQLYLSPNSTNAPVALVAARNGVRSVGLDAMVALRGQLPGPNSLGYLVSTTGFTPEALDEAHRRSEVKLVDLTQLQRYVAYVRGSRHERSKAQAISIEQIFRADSITRRSPTQTKILALANNKGGVAKTTTALNLAFALREKKQRVLLVDMDAQSNITQTLPPPPGLPDHVVPFVDYFLPDAAGRGVKLSQFVRPTQFDEICLIPSQRDLTLDDTSRADWPDTELRFVTDLHDEAVRPVKFGESHFDWIIIDTPPAMFLHTRAALAACHYVVAPVTASPFADSGLGQLFSTATAIRGLNTGIDILGCAVTLWEDSATKRATLAKLVDALPSESKVFRPYIFKSRIPVDQNVDKAHLNIGKGGRRHIFVLTTVGAGKAYMNLTEEVVRHVSNT